jgi:hypothetical protein
MPVKGRVATPASRDEIVVPLFANPFVCAVVHVKVVRACVERALRVL